MKIIITQSVDGRRNIIRYTGVKTFNVTCYTGMISIRLQSKYDCEKAVNGIYNEKAGKDWLEVNNASTVPYFHCIYNIESVSVV